MAPAAGSPRRPSSPRRSPDRRRRRPASPWQAPHGRMPEPSTDRSARGSARAAPYNDPDDPASQYGWTVRVLIFHGYLLRGTGSNVYNASLAQALAGQGHEVHLLCQDRNAADLDWVEAIGTWDGGLLEVEQVRDAGRPGTVTVYRPEIGGLLPV